MSQGLIYLLVFFTAIQHFDATLQRENTLFRRKKTLFSQLGGSFKKTKPERTFSPESYRSEECGVPCLDSFYGQGDESVGCIGCQKPMSIKSAPVRTVSGELSDLIIFGKSGPMDQYEKIDAIRDSSQVDKKDTDTHEILRTDFIAVTTRNYFTLDKFKEKLKKCKTSRLEVDGRNVESYEFVAVATTSIKVGTTSNSQISMALPESMNSPSFSWTTDKDVPSNEGGKISYEGVKLVSKWHQPVERLTSDLAQNKLTIYNLLNKNVYSGDPLTIMRNRKLIAWFKCMNKGKKDAACEQELANNFQMKFTCVKGRKLSFAEDSSTKLLTTLKRIAEEYNNDANSYTVFLDNLKTYITTALNNDNGKHFSKECKESIKQTLDYSVRVGKERIAGPNRPRQIPTL